MEKTSSNTKNTREDEIDIIALLKVILDGKKTIFKTTIIFIFIGILIAFSSPNQYSASITLVPQTTNSQSNKLGGLSSLAAMAGFNVGSSSSSEVLSPNVYPQILNSLPFQLELLNEQYIYSDKKLNIKLIDYYTEYNKPSGVKLLIKYTIGLPGLLLNIIKGDKAKEIPNNASAASIHRTTIDQDHAREALNKNLTISLNNEQGFIVLNSTFQDPYLAAQVTQKAFEMLQSYITKYKIEKANQQLTYIQDRFKEKKAEFEETQKTLAQFRDRNKNMSTALAQTEEQELQSKYNVAYSVYSELAKQLEQAQLKVKEDTPILTVINPVKVPNKKAGPKRLVTLIIMAIMGAILGIGIILFKLIYKTLKKQYNQL